MRRSYSETYKRHDDASMAGRTPTSGSAAFGHGVLVIVTVVGAASLRVATNGIAWATSRLRRY